jgi:hypothetical protein
MRIQATMRAGILGLAGLVGVTGCTAEAPVGSGGVNGELLLDGRILALYPFGIAVGADAAFVTVAEAPIGRIVRIPIDGGPATVIAADLDSPTAILADGDELFVTTSTKLLRLPQDGSAPPVELAPLESAGYADIAVDATHIYYTEYTDPGAVRRVARAGGSPETIATGDSYPSGIAVRGGRVYWNVLHGNVIRSANVDGSDVTTFASDQPAPRLALEATDDTLYWIPEAVVPATVMQAPLAGGAPVALGALTTHDVGYSPELVILGDYIYARTPLLEDGTCGIARLPLAGGPAEELPLDPMFTCPLAIAAGGSDLYFTFADGVGRIDLP